MDKRMMQRAMGEKWIGWKKRSQFLSECCIRQTCLHLHAASYFSCRDCTHKTKLQTLHEEKGWASFRKHLSKTKTGLLDHFYRFIWKKTTGKINKWGFTIIVLFVFRGVSCAGRFKRTSEVFKITLNECHLHVFSSKHSSKYCHGLQNKPKQCCHTLNIRVDRSLE